MEGRAPCLHPPQLDRQASRPLVTPGGGRSLRRRGFCIVALTILAGAAGADVFLRLPGGGRWGLLPSERFAPETIEDRAITVNGVRGRMAVFSAHCGLREFWDALATAQGAAAQGDDAVFAGGDRLAWGVVRRGDDLVRWMGIADPVDGSVTAFALRCPAEIPRADASMVPGRLSLPSGARPHLVVDSGDGRSLLLVLRTDGSPETARESIETFLNDGRWQPLLPTASSHNGGGGMYLRGNQWAVVASADEPGTAPRGVVTLWIAGREP